MGDSGWVSTAFYSIFFDTLMLTKSFGLSLAIALSLSLSPGIAQTSGDALQRADQLERRGIEQLQSGRVQDTLESWQEALEIYRQLGDKKQEMRLLQNFGNLFVLIEAPERAIAPLEASLKLAETLQDRPAQLSALLKLGEVYNILEKSDRALEIYQQSLEIATEFGDAEGVTLASGNLGQLQEERGNFEGAIAAYRQAQQVAETAGDSENELAVWGSMGRLYNRQQNYSRAAEAYNRAWFLARQLGDKSRQIATATSMASAYYQLGNCDYAFAFYDLSWPIARELGDREEEARILQNRGAAAYCLGNFDVALESYQNSLKIVRELGGDRAAIGQLVGNIGLTYIDLGRYSEGIEFLQQDLEIARETGEKQVEAQALGNLGNGYFFQRDYERALQFYRESLAIARQINYRRGVGLMLTNIGATLLELNRLPEAETILKEGIQVLDALAERAAETDEDRISLSERHLRSYQLLQQVLMAQNRPEEALVAAEAGRARGLAELLGRKLDRAQLDPPNWQEIKAIAENKNATLVTYSIIDSRDGKGQSQLYIWAVSPQGNIGFKSVDLESLNQSLSQLIDTSRSAMGIGGRGGLVAEFDPGAGQFGALQTLYQLLIEPIAEFLPSEPGDRVIFIPQGELFLVPFPALQDESGTFLIAKHTPLSAPSIQVLGLARRGGNSRGGRAVVVGNPVMPALRTAPDRQPEPLPPLPGAEREAREIAELLGTRPLLGPEATRRALLEQLPGAAIVHLATHGLLDVGSDGTVLPPGTRYAGFRGSGGAIALAPDNGDNGLLTAEEILDLRLTADLVVLSACDTGRGAIVGEGVLGLSRSVMAAGGSSAIVSLWAVPDAPTAELMVEFYRRWQQGGDKADALRQAMLKTQADYPDPRNWAAFTLIGSAE